MNGPSCVGKSTIIREVMKQKDNVFLLSFDGIKRNFSKYTPIVDYDKVRELFISNATFAFAKGYDVITDSSLGKENRESLISQAKDSGYDVVEINLEADESILRKRFEERVETSKNAIVKPANTSIIRWKELYDLYHHDKNKEAITFYTDMMSEEEIVEKVMEIF